MEKATVKFLGKSWEVESIKDGKVFLKGKSQMHIPFKFFSKQPFLVGGKRVLLGQA